MEKMTSSEVAIMGEKTKFKNRSVEDKSARCTSGTLKKRIFEVTHMRKESRRGKQHKRDGQQTRFGEQEISKSNFDTITRVTRELQS